MIYLDNSATTRTLDIATQAAEKYMSDNYFNTGAAYTMAVSCEKDVNAARERLAKAMGAASADEIIFTSGGTESNNMAFFGTLLPLREKGRIIISTVEHPSVEETAKSVSELLGAKLSFAKVDSNGKVDLEYFESILDSDVTLVSVMQVNNETGAINDIASIKKLIKLKAPRALLHVDGVQGFLKVPFDVKNCDLYSISGHKFHGPKGIGALYVKKGTKFAGGQTGGGQERGLRSGTLNTPGIMGMDAAVAFYLASKEALWQNMSRCKMHLVNRLSEIPDVVINGPSPQMSAPQLLNVSFLGVRGEVLLHALEEKGICVSTGSACAAKKQGKSRVLNEMGLAKPIQESAVRFSFSPFNTVEEIDATVDVLKSLLPLLRRFTRR
ncbi:MAG: cysteine desulfurase [Clostridia bacterium]|nr:cysteine desulfurase [Clostridia bacterium]